jgi:NADH-quinone oxidoreductase subunit K
VIVVAAAEATVGLAIIIALYQNRNSLNIEDLDSMKM